ncbi:Predicted metalloprotease, contains C-terminal PDZ domain [Polaromonas sp. OV174]|uniref:M61 family metallopeptidase n=1 Tax=Polaromonas sp. OV174 TaxID=1855300 RepID=UPI0008E84439|nr:M61 family metallopeptidase [Polaromonas sp. OV174]SFC02292.1 Predicted metalloprotease, contains C-terminal PDZ domain [Polaromonas sp. OV174]
MPTASRNTASPIHYRVDIGELHAHLFQVTLTIAKPAELQRVSLPVWIPGSYLVREFSKHLQGLQAHQGTRSALPVQQLDKCSWQVRCSPAKPLVLSYQVYAHDNSVRSAWLDAQRGFFNGTSLCLRVEGQESAPHVLELPANQALKGWSVATGLSAQKVNKQGFGSYLAADYDELADCPVEMGAFWSGSFTARGVPHRFVVAGAAPSFDGERLLADTQKICETEIRFWHGNKKPPFQSYLFMLNAVDDSYGGLEHRNSTALICNRKDLPSLGEPKTSDGYTTLRGLISHEYFHTWNVKRLRPAEFESYQYDRENYTELLWFFEGFTSYYDDLLLRHAGLLDNAGYLKLVNKTINQVMQTPGRQLQSVAEASFDAWVKYYRQDENTPNATVSYYTKGALVALCLDLTLRAEGRARGDAGATLDHVMRELWLRCKAGPLREADVAEALQAAGQRSFAPELARWVHGKGELPLKALLEQHGVAVLEDPAQMAHKLGLRVSEGRSVEIKTVLRGGLAERAGFAAGDEWLGLEPSGKAAAQQAGGWRLNSLDELTLYAGKAKKVSALVARDKRLLRLELTLPPALTTWRLAVKDAALLNAWLSPKA